jgi:hypothetical protein
MLLGYVEAAAFLPVQLSEVSLTRKATLRAGVRTFC